MAETTGNAPDEFRRVVIVDDDYKNDAFLEAAGRVAQDVVSEGYARRIAYTCFDPPLAEDWLRERHTDSLIARFGALEDMSEEDRRNLQNMFGTADTRNLPRLVFSSDPKAVQFILRERGDQLFPHDDLHTTSKIITWLGQLAQQ